MLSSMYSAVSGMNVNGTYLEVIGDNIANLNTTAFKASKPNFGDVLSASIGGLTVGGQAGRGALVQNIAPIMSQGSFLSTGNSLDMAIDGNGFFVVSDPTTGGRYYTRAGNFSMDKDGYIITPTGLRLQAYIATDRNSTLLNASNINGTLQALQIDPSINAVKITTDVDIRVNLVSTATTTTAAFTLDSNGDGVNDDPANYNYSTTLTVYDSQGGGHDVTAYFKKSSTTGNSWEVHYVTQDSSNSSVYTMASIGNSTGIGTATDVQTLTFNQDGKLTSDAVLSSTGVYVEPTVYFNFGTDVVYTQPITFNYGDSVIEGGTGQDATAQLADGFQVLDVSQDGNPPGTLKSVSIDEDGIVSTTFTNGQTQIFGQIALAKFGAPDQLTKLGNNIYQVSVDSGQAVVSAANTSGLGRILSETLESSNVDLAQEFVNMITAQRAFQANSRTVTTVDDMLQEVLSLKR